MKQKYLVFLVGMAAQEIETARMAITEDRVVFYADPHSKDVVAAFERSQMIGWRLVS